MLYQQGDVLMEKVADLPKGERETLTHRRLAEGEATGHFHGADSGTLLRIGTEIFLEVPDGTTVTHQEHAPIVLPPGRYRVSGVREFDHFAEEAEEAIRRVVD